MFSFEHLRKGGLFISSSQRINVGLLKISHGEYGNRLQRIPESLTSIGIGRLLCAIRNSLPQHSPTLLLGSPLKISTRESKQIKDLA